MVKEATKNNTEMENQMPTPKIKHDWYQTETQVIVTILAKNANNVNVVITETTLSVSAKLPNSSDYSLELDLAHHIVPEQCTHKVSPSKIEIKLKKMKALRWTVLDGEPEKENVQPIPEEILQSGSQPPKYPSSSKKAKDWDKIEKEIEKEENEEVKPNDGNALKELFQKLYANSSDDIRRAMNKSFQESGGTVLSTDWLKVREKKVEYEPSNDTE